MEETVHDCSVKSSKKHKQATKFGAGSSKARTYVYSYQFRFKPKLINERQTTNTVESQVIRLNKIEVI
jgi:hypothetical protein